MYLNRIRLLSKPLKSLRHLWQSYQKLVKATIHQETIFFVFIFKNKYEAIVSYLTHVGFWKVSRSFWKKMLATLTQKSEHQIAYRMSKDNIYLKWFYFSMKTTLKLCRWAPLKSFRTLTLHSSKTSKDSSEIVTFWCTTIHQRDLRVWMKNWKSVNTVVGFLDAGAV